jgi:hypothetical protein
VKRRSAALSGALLLRGLVVVLLFLGRETLASLVCGHPGQPLPESLALAIVPLLQLAVPVGEPIAAVELLLEHLALALRGGVLREAIEWPPARPLLARRRDAERATQLAHGRLERAALRVPFAGEVLLVELEEGSDRRWQVLAGGFNPGHDLTPVLGAQAQVHWSPLGVRSRSRALCSSG